MILKKQLKAGGLTTIGLRGKEKVERKKLNCLGMAERYRKQPPFEAVPKANKMSF
jgi:hypothetical protein